MNHLSASADTLAVVPYKDRKRYAWLFSLGLPLLACLGSFLYMTVQESWVFWVPVVMLYSLSGIMDTILGEDTNNPPESAVPGLEADPYYRWITWLLVPLLWAEVIFNVWYYATHDLTWYETLPLILSIGFIGGLCINLGHELGHKNNPLERWLAKLILATSGYGHFFIEHNRGHHRDVATPEDPASSRMGESIYRFVLREMPGAFFRAWGLERERLNRANKSVWSLENEVIQPMLITAALWGGLALWLGWEILPFMVCASFWANFQLTSANYIEHYGLLRQKLPNGRYERCEPHHSWNSNHIFSNWSLFHLQRHSDHHAHPTRRYQSLRHFESAPQLPSGYPVMFLVAYIPPLWYRVMDKRLIKVVNSEAKRINFAPGQRERLIQKYALKSA